MITYHKRNQYKHRLFVSFLHVEKRERDEIILTIFFVAVYRIEFRSFQIEYSASILLNDDQVVIILESIAIFDNFHLPAKKMNKVKILLDQKLKRVRKDEHIH